MQYGGVVLAAELFADLRKRSGGELLHQEHGNLTRESDHFRVAADFKILRAHAEVFAHALLNLLDGDFLFLGLDDRFKDLLGG